MINDIEALGRMISSSKHLCVFTGAGISCPSGIPDFRSADGLYNQSSGGRYRPEEIISHSFFMSHTSLFYKFYREKMIYPSAEPNQAHLYFSSLEKSGKRVSIVTQNIDGLHTKAGSQEVYELHGSVHRNYCTKCGRFFGLDAVTDCVTEDGIPHCPYDGGIIKPDVVLYGEPLDDETVRGAANAISTADTLIIIGTSLAVYPAASYIGYFHGDNSILINKSPTEHDASVSLAIYDDVINVISALTHN